MEISQHSTFGEVEVPPVLDDDLSTGKILFVELIGARRARRVFVLERGSVQSQFSSNPHRRRVVCSFGSIESLCCCRPWGSLAPKGGKLVHRI